MSGLWRAGGAFLSWKIKATIALVLLVPALVATGLLTMFASAQTQGQQGVERGLEIPAQYVNDVMRAGGICKEVTANVIAAQISAESSWNPNATSSAGAKGISQFMPSTWAVVGRDGDGDEKADVMNPHDAIFTQGHYMCDQVSRLREYLAQGKVKGNIVELALAAYNAGLGRVLTAGGIPPISQTQNYVKTITERAASYAGGGGVIAATGNVKDALEWASSIARNPRSFYTWGGEGPLGYDCSGLTQEFMARLGVSIPHQADLQARLGTPVTQAQARPGDLIFWSTNAGAFYYHTAIYIGGGQMISADSPQAGINIEPIWGTTEHIIFRRFLTN